MTEKTWMLYGATGDTGVLILAEALRRGHHPVVAGRSAEKVRALAERHGLPWVAVSLDDPAGLHAALEPLSLVLNAAGPFAATSPALMDAAVEAGVHYLDIANEIPVFQAAVSRQAAAQTRGVGLMPGVGYGVIVADSLAGYLAGRVPTATHLELALMPFNQPSGSGGGATRTSFEILAGGGRVQRNGRLVAYSLGAGGRRLPAPNGEHNILPLPTGDLAAAAQTTGIANITTYWDFPMPSALARLVVPVLSRLMAIPALRQRLSRPKAKAPTLPAAQPTNRPQAQQSYAWGQASGPDGQTAEAWIETGEGYAFTAAAAVRSAEQVLALQPRGAVTPARAFGADFVLTLPGVYRHDGALASVAATIRQREANRPPTRI